MTTVLASQNFGVAAMGGSAMWILVLIGLLVTVLALFTVRLLYGLYHVEFVVEPDALRIKAPLYGRSVPRAALDLSRAEVTTVAPGSERDHKRFGRKGGAGLPGCKLGWFAVPEEKGLVFISDPSRVLWLPTTEGYTLVLGAADPEGLLAALRGEASA